ncbi:MAG: PEP-CTERM sorting domain-containing protein [Planctomycetota bacterium]|jgi:hypothetical protein
MKSCIFVIVLTACICSALQASVDFTISEDILLSGEFASRSWGAANVSRADVPGEAVRFSFTGLTGSGTGLKDNYPVQDYGQVLPSHGSGDFSIFDGYSLWVSNTGQTDVTVSLFLNTGFTGPSGVPSSDWTNDTFWQSSWQGISPGQWFVLRLDFDNARPFNISDNKDPHTHGTNGQWTVVNAYDRAEVSAIGFEVLGNGEGTILVGPSTIPEPGTLLLFGLGFVMIRRKHRPR